MQSLIFWGDGESIARAGSSGRKRQEGRDVAKSIWLLFAFVLVSVLAGAQDVRELGQQSGEADFIGPTSSAGSALMCSSAPQVLRVPAPVLGRAKIKARLIMLLRESLFDDAKGIVNIARENEIKKLVSKLKNSE